MTGVVTIANSSSIPYFPIKPKPASSLLAYYDSAAVSVSTKHLRAIEFISTRRIRRRRWNLPSSDNQTAAAVIDPATSTSSADDKGESSPPLASEVVRNFYAGINRHDLSSVEDLIAHGCVYEDLIFPRPFVGRKAILDFFQKFIDSISTDLQFVIDDISNEDTSAVGVMWHLGMQLLSAGCGKWKETDNDRNYFGWNEGRTPVPDVIPSTIANACYGRDSVEPAVKPGEMALVAIRGVTWLLQQFPQLADQL